MKLIKLLTVLAALIFISSTLHAQEAFKTNGTEACGGVIKANDDSANHGWKNDNKRNSEVDRDVMCCPKATRLSGLVYTKDNREAGKADIESAGPYCRKYGDRNPDSFVKDEDYIDHTRNKEVVKTTVACPSTAIVTGFVWKDGKKSDDMKAATAVCFDPVSKKTWTVANPDMAVAQGNEYKTDVKLPDRIVGLSYYERGFDIDAIEAVVRPNYPIVK